MKTLISIVVAIILMWLVFFKIDPAIVGWFLNLLPASANDWKPFLKVIGWIIMVLVTGGLTIWVSVIVGGLVYAILKGFSK